MWKFLTKVFKNPWFGLTAICAFLAFGSIVSVDSAWSDSFNGNWLFISLAIVFGLSAVFCIWKANETSGGNTGYKQ